ncbi:COX15/CtaA family protein [Abyssibius alkaniclasticus]|uniref:heme A synthase n=1 Tax=Abyssibius alkaniclasticus TaxID=2881234 RepID=UPI0023649F12|nr:heme A synthase [Abyssibius alkaniclasticus]UPH70507.1 COX15/CtaA family protein [Abyssibius alkaniclasticus]
MPSIFEEVGSDTKQAAQTKTAKPDARRAIARWLMVLFGLVVLIIAVGGLTRLTDSGLSITEWNLLMGTLPPLSDAAWADVFTKYQASPEYQLQNSQMDLAAFKSIFWWEWGHRLLGRIIGLAWFLGYAWFALRGRVPSGWHFRLVLIGALIGLQGLVGWWMVSSGLVGRMVDVASYRLALHLGLAFVILGLIAWYVLRLGKSSVELLQARRAREVRLFRLGGVLVGLLFAQILLGALVAGIDAGRSFPTWPLMAGEFLPSESFGYTPIWSNFFENPALVQFNHRLLGYIAFVFGLFVWWQARKSALRSVRKAFNLVALALLLQLGLGVGTVLLAAPLDWALAHQLGAVLLFVLVIRARFRAGYPARQSLR